MVRRSTPPNPLFDGRWFEDEIIVLCLRWYFRYKLSYRDLVEMMGERGLPVAHTTILRWAVRCITDWQSGEAERGCADCFHDWIARHGSGAHDTSQMIRQVRHFLQANGSARFQLLPKSSNVSDCRVGGIPIMAGYLRVDSDRTLYLFLSEVFRVEVCKGYECGQVLAALMQAGYLLTDSKRMSKQQYIGKVRLRFYAVRGSILESDATNEV